MAKRVPLPEKYPLPDNWTWVEMGQLTDMKSGFPFNSKRFSHDPDGRRPLIRIRDVVRGETETYTDEPCPEEYLIHAGEILIGMDGDFNAARWNSADALLNQRVCRIESKGGVLLNAFLFYYLPIPLKSINDVTPSMTVKHLSTKTLSATPFPLPPLPEQARIVERLESLFTRLDEARDKAQAVLDGYEYRRAAILHKAFTGELTAKWRARHGVSLESWKTVRLSDVCTVNPPKTAVKNLPDTLPVSFIPMSAVSAETGTVTDRQTRPLEEVRNGFPNFSEGDILFAKITPCMENGKSALVGKLVNDIGYGSTEFYVIRCGEELSNRLLLHLVRGAKFRQEAKAVMTGSVGQMRTPRKFIEQYEISLPSKAEQEQIVLLLDTLFDKEQQTKASAERVLESVGLMKKSILVRAFRGLLGTNQPQEGKPIP